MSKDEGLTIFELSQRGELAGVGEGVRRVGRLLPGYRDNLALLEGVIEVILGYRGKESAILRVGGRGCEWCCDRLKGSGVLYAPLESGMAAVWVNLWNQELAAAYAEWGEVEPYSGVRVNQALVVQPGEYRDRWGDFPRLYFFYQEGLPGILHLKHFGYGGATWYETEWAGISPVQASVKLAGVKEPAFMQVEAIEAALRGGEARSEPSLHWLREQLLGVAEFSFS